jgi:hypothetical protein
MSRRPEEQLLESVWEHTTIECTKCLEEQETDGGIDQALEFFYSDGWRATERNTYCPKCAKKFLKKRKA